MPKCVGFLVSAHHSAIGSIALIQKRMRRSTGRSLLRKNRRAAQKACHALVILWVKSSASEPSREIIQPRTVTLPEVSRRM
eukprot:14482746-Alexandrium_andersonii.AAC.1